MEPLDPKAELMRLARECGDIERRHCIGKAQGFDVRDAYIALESAITLALAAERRRALTDAAQACKRRQIKNEDRGNVASANTAECCHDDILDLVDGKAGGT